MKFVISESQFQNIINNSTQEESKNLLNEGQNEDKALNILKVKGEEKDTFFLKQLEKLKANDSSDNHKLLPYMAIFLLYNPSSLSEIFKIFKIFEPIFKKRNIKISYDLEDSFYVVNIMDHNIQGTELNTFENLVNHLKFKDSPDDKPEIEIISVGTSKVFDSEKFAIYHGGSHQVCVELLWGEPDEETKKGMEIVGARHDFCIGNPDQENYTTYRLADQKTFYIIFDKTRVYKRMSQNKFVDPLICVIIQVNSDGTFTGVDERNSEGKIEGFSGIEQYITFLYENGVPKGLFKKTKGRNVEANIKNLLKNFTDDEKFYELNPEEKNEYFKMTKNITEYQMKFLLNFMPEKTINTFITNGPDLKHGVYNLLNSNLKKKLIDRKLTMMANNGQLDIPSFMTYLTESSLLDYAISRMQKISDDQRGFSSPSLANKLLSLISPTHFFKTLVGKSEVHINKDNYLLGYIPDNINEYIKDASSLYINKLSIHALPESMGTLTNLELIDIADCPIINLPKSFINLHNLKSFFASSLKITEMPNIFNSLDLELLSITDCELQSIPKEIDRLQKLKILNITGNKITELPSIIGNFPNLVLLSMEDNPFTSLPKSLSKYDSEVAIVVPDALQDELDKIPRS